MNINVVAVDDHRVALLGIERIIAGAVDIELVGKYHSMPEVLAHLANPNQPKADVVLLDLRLGKDSDPLDNVLQLTEAGMPVLVYSSLESPYLMRRAMAGGVCGLVEKTAEPELLLEALRVAAAGQTFATSEWAGLIDSDPLLDAVELSPRQREVVELYAMGVSAREVGVQTGLSQETVQDYLSRIRVKYSLAGRPAVTKVDLFRRAQEDGFLPGPHE